MVFFCKNFWHIKSYGFLHFEGLLLLNGRRYMPETVSEVRMYTLDKTGRKTLVFGLNLGSGPGPKVTKISNNIYIHFRSPYGPMVA